MSHGGVDGEGRSAAGDAARARTPFVGRDDQLAELAGAVTQATTGRGSLVLVTGEPGIGKTRLVEELTESTASTATVLWGRCLEGGTPQPYQPFAEIVGAAVRAPGASAVLDGLGSATAVLAWLVPEAAEVLGAVEPSEPLDRDEELLRLFDAVARLLVGLSENGPVVVVVDDLHWADEGTAALFRHVARFTEVTPLVVVGAYREDELDRRHPMADALAGLRRQVAMRRVQLRGLPKRGVGDLVRAIAGGQRTTHSAFVDAVHAETGGNPFFIREMTLHVLEEGDLDRATSRQARGLPQGVREVIGRRLSRLSADANAVLRTASALEGAFRFDVVIDAAGLTEGAALDALDEALSAGIVRETVGGEEYDFTHTLIRHTLYAELDPSARVRTHRALGDALVRASRRRPSSAIDAQVARHYALSAALPGAAAGADAAIRAASAAEAGRDFDQAVRLLRIATELLDENDPRGPDARRRIALALPYSARPTEAMEAARTAVESMIAAGETGDVADFLAQAARAVGDVGLDRDAWALAREGLDWIGDRRDATWAWLVALDATRRAADDDGQLGIAVLDEKVLGEMRRAFAAHANEKRAYVFIPVPSREAALATQADDPVALLFLAGEFRRALVLGLPRADDAVRGERTGPAVFWSTFVARCHLALGDLDAGEAAFARALEQAGRFAGRTSYLVDLAATGDELTLARDEGWEGEVAQLDAFLGDRPPEAQWAMAAIQAAGARLMARLGDVDRSLELVSHTLPAIERVPGYARNYVRIVCDLGHALWLLDRDDHLDVIERNVREKVVEPDFRYPMVDGRLTLARLATLAGRYDEASTWFGAAREVLTEQGARPLLAITDLDEARMRSRQGDRTAVSRLAERARQQFDTLGMRGWVGQARGLL